MTQEEKHTLLVDLCARLPYGVKVRSSRRRREPVTLSLDIMTDFHLGYSVKPYLRTMESMAEEEKKELSKRYVWEIINGQIYIRYHSDGLWDEDTECPTEEYLRLFDWLNKKMFDYRGLIPMGLGLEALKDMYDTKTE